MARDAGVKRMERLANDDHGQLLLITGVVLTLMLLILATINTESANTLRTPTHQSDIGTNEINDVTRNYRIAVEEFSKEYSSSLPKKEAIGKAFDDVGYNYNNLLSARGIIFKTYRGPIESVSMSYRMNVTISLIYQIEGETSTISQNLRLEIMFE